MKTQYVRMPKLVYEDMYALIMQIITDFDNGIPPQSFKDNNYTVEDYRRTFLEYARRVISECTETVELQHKDEIDESHKKKPIRPKSRDRAHHHI
jgi:hypothetical protein